MRIRFGSFTLDAATRQLLDGDQAIHLSPKAFDVLCTLVAERPKVVNKGALHDRIWPGTFVVDANLSVLVGEIRKALADSASDPRFIRTVHKVGYAFCGTVIDGATGRMPAATAAGSVRSWLTWDERRFVLTPGDHVVGRDPGSSIWLDASGVSRRHAKVTLEPNGAATLEDLGSTNGTFVGEQRISGPAALDDGALVHVGSVTLTYRAWRPDQVRATERIVRPRAASDPSPRSRR